MKLLGFLGKGLIGLIFKYWWVLATIIILFNPMAEAITDGIEQKDFRIPLNCVGTLILSADEGISEEVEDLDFDEKKGKGWEDLANYYSKLIYVLFKALWKHLWMIIFWFLLFFKGEKFLMGNDSKSLRAFVVALLTMVLLQILMYGIPFKGVYSLIKFIIQVV